MEIKINEPGSLIKSVLRMFTHTLIIRSGMLKSNRLIISVSALESMTEKISSPIKTFIVSKLNTKPAIHPYGKGIPSQRSSELFGLLTEESQMDYFRYQAKRHSCDEYLAFDTTSISSYSSLIKRSSMGRTKKVILSHR